MPNYESNAIEAFRPVAWLSKSRGSVSSRPMLESDGETMLDEGSAAYADSVMDKVGPSVLVLERLKVNLVNKDPFRKVEVSKEFEGRRFLESLLWWGLFALHVR